MSSLDPEDLASFVAASCRAQGVPVKVTDAVVVDRVRALLGGGAQRANPAAAAAGSHARTGTSESPDDLDSGGVQRLRSGRAGMDGNPVDHGFDDGGLLVQVEVGPLSA